MCDLGLEVGWQVDNVDGAEWALLWADTTSYAQRLGNEGDLGLWGDFDTETSTADDWAGLFALLSTFLWLTLVAVDDRDTSEFIGHLGGFGL